MSERVEISAVLVPAIRAAAENPTMFIQTDENIAQTDPPAAPWARIIFKDGAEEQVSIGGEDSLFRQPIVVFVDHFTEQNIGDGLAVQLAKATRNALRRLNVTGARWSRFLEGVEGNEGAFYRKQVIAVFTKSERV